MAPIFYLIMLLIFLILGFPVLMEMREEFIRDIQLDWGGAPGTKAVVLFGMVGIVLAILYRIARDGEQ